LDESFTTTSSGETQEESGMNIMSRNDQVKEEEVLAAIDIAAIGKGVSKIIAEHREIRPFFSSAWVAPSVPEGAQLLEEYTVGDSTVRLYDLAKETESLYHVTPFEYGLPVDLIKLAHITRKELSEHHPKDIQLTRQERARAYVTRVAEEIILRNAKTEGIKLGADRLEEMKAAKRLALVIAKYTTGFGVSETFLEDEHIQDVYIDSPPLLNPVYLTIGGFSDKKLRSKCKTNVFLAKEDYEALLSRFRYESGRPFSEAMPVLEHNLSAYDARVTVIGRPLSPNGLAIAIRRHSPEPWTLLKFIANGTLSSIAAGLISFLVDGRSTVLVAGSRGSGKTSLLSAIMLEIPQSQRTLTIEDTQELPTHAMQELGYKVQSMLVQSSLGGKGEMTADEALRVSLRLGESVIILGEVRGQEARTLYEAMRAGTAGSSVMGTFHADSAKSVYERVTHDMGIPSKSFSATDVVIIAGLTRPGGTQRELRRLTQIAEVKKSTGRDGDFNDLMAYSGMDDEILPTEIMTECSERIAEIAKSWGISYEDAIKDIELRATYRQIMVDYAKRREKPALLSPKWISMSNNAFWNLMEKHYRNGRVDYESVLEEWVEWFERSALYE
jgi:type IV secretory pathway ATPase VirB11/archaellum biosynthesis ATPase